MTVVMGHFYRVRCAARSEKRPSRRRRKMTVVTSSSTILPSSSTIFCVTRRMCHYQPRSGHAPRRTLSSTSAPGHKQKNTYTDQTHQRMKTSLQERALRASGLALALILTASASQAAIIIGNLSTNATAASNISPTVQKAAVFTMGSQAYTVDSVILTLSSYNTATDVARVGFFLEGANSLTPGAQVGSFLTAPSSSSNNMADFTFSPSGSLTLAANTRYWLLVDANVGSSNFIWSLPDPVVTPSGTAATFDFSRGSSNNGSSYSNSSVHNSFQINGTQVTAVPEPGTFLPAALLVMGALLRRRRPRSHRSSGAAA